MYILVSYKDNSGATMHHRITELYCTGTVADSGFRVLNTTLTPRHLLVWNGKDPLNKLTVYRDPELATESVNLENILELMPHLKFRVVTKDDLIKWNPGVGQEDYLNMKEILAREIYQPIALTSKQENKFWFFSSKRAVEEQQKYTPSIYYY